MRQKSPFVRVTQGRKVRVKLDRKVRYELDGGDRKKVKSFKVKVEPGGDHRVRPGRGTERECSEMKTDVGMGSRDLGDKAKQGGHELAHAKTLGWLARAGLVARGVVYGIIGILALKLALGDGGKATDQEGALQTIAQPAVRQDCCSSWSRSASAGTRSGG